MYNHTALCTHVQKEHIHTIIQLEDRLIKKHVYVAHI